MQASLSILKSKLIFDFFFIFSVGCFDALSVQKNHVKLSIDTTFRQPDAGKVSMVTYGYGDDGCTWKPNHCGPNYCCCKAIFV